MLIDGFTLFGSWPGLPYDHPIDHLISGLSRFKLDRACTLSSKGIFFDAAVGNETTWTTCQQDNRLVPIGVADPRTGGIEHVDQCKRQGFKLMALFPASQGWSFDNIAARLVLRHLAAVNLPVLVEVGREGMISELLEAAQGLNITIILLDVTLPTVNEIISFLRSRPDARHPYIEALRAPLNEAMSILRGGPNVLLATRLLCGGDTIEYLVQNVGADRLVFTSRFPISCFSSAFLTAKFADINDADRAAVMGGNLLKLLNAV